MNLSEKIKTILKMRNVQYGIGIFFIVFLVWFSFKPKKVSAELATIHRGTLIQYVEEEGISRVKEKYSILSPVNGVLKRVEKHAGDVVKKGEIVASNT